MRSTPGPLRCPASVEPGATGTTERRPTRPRPPAGGPLQTSPGAPGRTAWGQTRPAPGREPSRSGGRCRPGRNEPVLEGVNHARRMEDVLAVVVAGATFGASSIAADDFQGVAEARRSPPRVQLRSGDFLLQGDTEEPSGRPGSRATQGLQASPSARGPPSFCEPRSLEAPCSLSQSIRRSRHSQDRPSRPDPDRRGTRAAPGEGVEPSR